MAEASALRLNTAVLWPGESADKIAERLKGYLDAGTAKVEDWDEDEQDAGQIAWARYIALDDVYQARVNLPSTVADSDEGSSSYSAAQLQALKDERDAALAEFTALEEAAEAETPTEVQPRGSSQSRIRFVW